MWEWLTKNKWKILLALIAFGAGFAANIYANRQSEKRIIDALTAEIESIKNKAARTLNDQQRLIELQAQLNLLQNK